MESADLASLLHQRYPHQDRFTQLAVDQWHRLIQMPSQDWLTSSEQDQAQHLGSQLASLLSARTGQSENPSKMAMMTRI
jgi:hypothetical protein